MNVRYEFARAKGNEWRCPSQSKDNSHDVVRSILVRQEHECVRFVVDDLKVNKTTQWRNGEHLPPTKS
ncbi:hypothetical protein TNCV_3481321 [Trichonephila clavipes]|nr:hypothetical protein TNCV_3481321 [Trichonephila clavipes]